MQATAAAVCAMGFCGEQAYAQVCSANSGTGSFRMHLMDAMSKLTPEQLEGGAKLVRFEK